MTDARARLVDFSAPFLTDVREVVVTASGDPPPQALRQNEKRTSRPIRWSDSR